jgi:hypothetical protein
MLLLARIYLIAVSVIYLALAIWCSVSPTVTSEKVGFELKGGSGQSEFMTVYGGLEFGLALVLLLPVFKQEAVNYGVLACLLVHGSLCLFRTISFFCFSDIGPMTYKLAIGEWVIFLLGAAIWYFNRQSAS